MTWSPDQEAVARDAMIHQWDPVSYLFPPVPLIMKTLLKVKQDQIQAGYPHHSGVAVSVVVANPARYAAGATDEAAPLQGGDLHGGQQPRAPLPEPADSGSHSRVDPDLDDFLSNHLATGTLKGYRGSFAKFSKYCADIGENPKNCSPVFIASYLKYLHESGSQFSTINYARSSISKFHDGFSGTQAGCHKLVSMAVKAVFKLNPPLPRYTSTFDPSLVLNYLKNLPSNSELYLKLLSQSVISPDNLLYLQSKLCQAFWTSAISV